MDFGPYNNSLGHLNGFIDLEASKVKYLIIIIFYFSILKLAETG
jgi:hypothetical protein